MTIDQIIKMAEKRIIYLEESKIAAERIGDVDTIGRLVTEIAATQETINQLVTLI